MKQVVQSSTTEIFRGIVEVRMTTNNATNYEQTNSIFKAGMYSELC